MGNRQSGGYTYLTLSVLFARLLFIRLFCTASPLIEKKITPDGYNRLSIATAGRYIMTCRPILLQVLEINA